MESNFQEIIPARDSSNERKRPTEASDTQMELKEPPSPEFLCQDCVKLDLSKAFSVEDTGHHPFTLMKRSGGNWGYFSDWAIHVGHRYRVARITNCKLCQMFFNSRVDEGDPKLDGDGDWIRAVSFLKMSSLFSPISKYWKSKDFPILMLFRNKNCNLYNNKEKVKNLIQLSGYAALQQLNQQQTVPLFPRAVPPVFDLGTFQNWFDYCKNNHKLLCRSPKSDLRGTHVIDCQEQSITEYEPGMPYVALSYVWGQPQAQRAVNDGKRLPTQLSLLIRDAVAVTQAMGFRYLWIDRYCIDQNNPTVKHEQIRQMDAIYSNAEVTIIAAAGQDENHGLSGVGRNRPTTRMEAHVGDVAVVWAPKDPQEAIKSSKWSTRGWTFQEAVLSRRRLVFTEQQAYFECNAMNVYESLNTSLDSLHIEDRSKSHEYLRRGVFGANRVARFGKFALKKHEPVEVLNQYLSNVEEYTSRKLTYAEDSLNAFRGIAQQFSYGKHAVYNIWGLAYRTPPEERMSSFVHSLSWRHTRNCWDLSQSAQRRPQFPSWSWAGWEGEVRYELDSSKDGVWFRNLVGAISLDHQTNSPIALEMIAPNPDEACISPVVILTAAVVPSGLISLDPNAASDQQWRWQIGGYKAILALSSGSVSESQFAKDIHDNHIWQCVCIGGTLRRSMVMILKIDDGSDLWERAGVFAIECHPFSLRTLTEASRYESFRVR